MATSKKSVSSRRGKLNYEREFKQQIVSEATSPGVSVASVAAHHGLHPNMVFRWIRLARTAERSSTPPALLEVLPVREEAVSPVVCSQAEPVPGGYVEVVLARGTVRVQGEVAPAMLRLAIEALGRLR